MAPEHVDNAGTQPAASRVTAALRLVRRGVGVALRHPSVTGEAVRALLATAPRHWWRRRPFLPFPADDYVASRAETAYGTRHADTPEDDLYHYLVWRRRQRRLR